MKEFKILIISIIFLSNYINLNAQKIEKVIGTITDKAVAGTFGPDTNGNYGYQYYRNDLIVDASLNDFNNLVLKMRVYVENYDNPGDLSFIQNSFGQIELANTQGQTTTYLTWQIKDLNLQSGWNDLYLDFSSGKKNSGMSTSTLLTYFRFILRQATKPDNFSLRLADVKIVDKSILVDPPVVSEVVWNTDYLVGNIDYNLTGNIKNANGFSMGKTITPINVSAHNPRELYLLMDVDISEQNTGDLNALLSATGQIELTSGGTFDKFEKSWNINDVDWKIGKYTYSLSLNNTLSTGGTIDLTNINYMRIFAVKVSSTFSGNLSFKVSNVRIVDCTNQTMLPTIFSDHMMFQQNKPIKIWGYAIEGKNISVKLLKNGVKMDSVGTVCSESKKWEISFPQCTGGYDKYQMIVFDNGDTLKVIDDILIGEIWLSAGQSNMALNVSQTIDGATLMANANNPNIRCYLEPTYPYSGSATGEQPVYQEIDVSGACWRTATRGANIAKLSAVAYSMAVELQEKLNIPVGILNTSVGGSVIEAWLPRTDIENDADLVLALKRKALYLETDWWVNNSNSMTALYNQKIAPLNGFNLAGVIWYQGEGNSSRPELYTVELDMLKKAYEREFGFELETMPFVFSQVCPWLTNLDNPQFLTGLSEAMTDTWKLHENSMGMVPLYDMDLTYVGNVPIHPTNKTPVGNRFATSVYNLVYNHSGEYTAPVFDSFNTQGDSIIVKFKHVGDGLKTIDGLEYVRGFSICNNDSSYVNAKAVVQSTNEVKVWSEYVKNPKQVTYAWATYNVKSNLANSENIIAAPFRSDRISGYKYFNPQDWMYADGDIWGIDSTDFVGFIPAWQTFPQNTNDVIILSYDNRIKSEGNSSLKVSYTAINNGTVCFGPVLSHKTTVNQFNNFNYVSFDVYNPDDNNKVVELQIIDKSNNVYNCVIANSAINETTVSVDKTVKFRTLNFDLRKLKNSQDEIITNPEAVLNNLNILQVVIKDNNSGSFYIDNVMFGITSADESTLTPLVKNDSINISVAKNEVTVNSIDNDLLHRIDVFDILGNRKFTANSINNQYFTFHFSENTNKFVIMKVKSDNNLLVKKIFLN